MPRLLSVKYWGKGSQKMLRSETARTAKAHQDRQIEDGRGTSCMPTDMPANGAPESDRHNGVHPVLQKRLEWGAHLPMCPLRLPWFRQTGRMCLLA
mmetsp:Transcript_114198/g.333890  ORF Transcript_114198/g.333890 Transcript_114198/m.333890 type:complete len:96 (-) Transcript_114198:3113-3400(-)